MAEYTSSALSILTTFFASEDIEHTARRIDFVKRASPIIGKLFLALVTFGVWDEANTTLAQWAAQVSQMGDHAVQLHKCSETVIGDRAQGTGTVSY